MKLTTNIVVRSRVLAAMLALTWSAAGVAEIIFEDDSETTNMTGFTETWGASWGDYNADNWPDLFNQGHRDFPRFYRNNGDGSFEDVAYAMDPGNWIIDPFDDKHGASFADWDNDGDEDILIGVSSTGPAIFMVNQNAGESFVDRASQSDLAPDDAARLPVWFDYDNDGNLDVAQVHTKNATLRRRDPDDGSDPDIDFDTISRTDSQFECAGKLNYAQLIDLDGNGSLDIVCAQEGVFPVAAYDYQTFPFTNITGSTIPTLSNVNDSVVADFNNDLLYDMVVTRGAIRPSGATLVGDNRLEIWMRKDDSVSGGKAVHFQTEGPVTVGIDHKGMGVYEDTKTAVVDKVNNTNFDVGPNRLQYQSAQDRWRARVDTGGTNQVYFQIESATPITNVEEFQFDGPEGATETIHLVNGPTGLQPVYNTGLYVPVFCGSAAAGDFDNDMDVDLYLVCRRGAENLPNRMYENQGDGTFVEVLNHGAEGPTGAGFEFGVGDSVVLADYNVDGYLDMYLANGLLYYPIGVGGQENMILNKGTGNNWIEIDLVGTTSNRDGVGAKVYLTAGGVTQLREQNGGYHRWSQNHQRIHFGLAQNLTADITIEWPSGQVDTYTNVAANALYDAVEGSTISPAVLGPTIATTLNAGDECGEPPYNLDYGPAVLLWKDCGTGIWSLRAHGGREDQQLLITGGNVLADEAFSSVAGVNLTGGDVVDSTNPNDLQFSIGTWFSQSRGFDFSTEGQTQSCFNVDVQDIPVLIVGSSRKKMSTPFDLITLGDCAPPPEPPAEPIECGSPNVWGPGDFGFFAWRECFQPGEDAVWRFAISGGGSDFSGYRGIINSDTVPTGVIGFLLEPSDTFDSVPGDNEVDFELFVGGTGVDFFGLTVPAGSQTCLVIQETPDGAGLFVGADREPFTGGFDLLTLEPCELPPEPPECGRPTFDQEAEPGIYVWRDCDAPGPDQQWSVLVPGGGAEWSPYEGALTSSTEILSPVGFSIEGHDTFDTVPGDNTVDFIFKVGGRALDGFDIALPEGANACFEATVLSNGAQVVLGANNQIMTGPFDLQTQQACP